MRRLFSVLASFALIATVAAPVTATQPAAAGGKARTYIVVLAEPSVYAYKGGIAGIAATAPGKAKKADPAAANVQSYTAHLKQAHDNAIAKVRGARKLYDYGFAFNGFAAIMTPAQASQLRGSGDALFVVEDQMRHVDTDNTPTFLGLTNQNGLWAKDGGQGSAGEGVIVGVVDTGIWPEHPSFSDRAGNNPRGRLVYDKAKDFFGTCQTGEQWPKNTCNRKLVGARYFADGFIAATGGIPGHEYLSARDAEGHGTHTASTAAGNAGVNASIFGRSFGTISGIAPRARVAAYKALWGGSGTTSDLAAAIDTAVSDGVDVINYSIGSDTPSLSGGDEIAFLFANDAGVFSSVSNGNAGPNAGTTGSPASVPWVTAVGASTQNRTFQSTLTLGSGAQFNGVSVTPGTNGQRPLVDSVTAANGVDNPDVPGNDVTEAQLCQVGELDPAKVTGKIVLCLRGTNARVDKSLAVKEAGGVGMILYNPVDAQALVTDTHWVPSIHINFTNGTAVKAYIASAGATATAAISDSIKVPSQGSVMADFSSRGPDGAANDIIKPDVTAPGVNILAGHTPTPPRIEGGAPGQLFQSISGTSMSAPHVAGVAALLKQLHPGWNGDMIKSALMTTGRQDVVKENGTTAADPFDFGGGHIVPNSAADPGLVYQASFNEYLAFLCEADPSVFTNPTATCNSLRDAGYSTDPSDLNLASIGVGRLVGSETVTRTVTSVASGSTSWTASVQGIPGFATVPLAPFTVAAGASHSFDLTFSRTTAAFGTWSFGALVLTDGVHTVRSPIALRAARIEAPTTVTATGAAASGSTTFDVRVGYSGTLSANGYGLAADTPQTVHVPQDADQDVTTGTFTTGVVFNDFTLTGARYYAGGITEDSTVVGDLDVYLFRDVNNDGTFGLNEIVASAADGDSNEIAQLVNPANGNYRLLIHGYGAPPAGVDVTRHQWTVVQATASPDTGSLVATAGAGDPKTVAINDTVTITAAWSGLATAGLEYRGVVALSDGTLTLSNTVIRVIR